MHRAFCLIVMLAGGVLAQTSPLDRDLLTPEKTAPKLLHAVLATNAESEPTNKFFSDTKKIDAFWKGSGLKAGDQVHAFWIAEDVGALAPKNSKITEAAVTVYKPDDDGAFALVQPEGGWPIGKYRLELFINQKLAQTLKFTIERGVTIEVGRDSN